MKIKELLRKIEEAKKEGIITDNSDVCLGIPHEIYRAKDGKEKGQLVPGSVTAMRIQYVIACDFAEEEEDAPANFLEIGLHVKDAWDLYRHHELIVSS